MNRSLRTTRRWVTTLWIGLLGLGATATVSAWLSQRIENDAQAAFDRVAEQIAYDVTRRFTQPVYGLRGLAGTYAASEQVTASEFRAYMDERNLGQEFPGVRGFGFIERVPDEALDAWLAEARADDAPALEVRSLSSAPPSPRYVIRYVEPFERNAGARGLDVGSETHRRQAVEHAIDSGLPALSRPIVLVQDASRTPGFLVCLPLYAQGRDPVSPTQRRAALRGVLYAPIVAAELLADVSRVAGGGLAEFALSADTTVFDSAPPGTGRPWQAPHRAERSVEILDQRLSLSVRSTPAFEATVDRSPVWLVAFGGGVITLLLMGLSRTSDAARWRAERRVAEMTDELQRLAAVARATADGVLLLDPERRIVWVNEAFTRTTGYTLEEARGRQPSRLLGSDEGDAQGVARMRATLTAGQTFRGELRNRRKDGSAYWIDVEIQPQHGEDGAIVGWIAVESDITTRRETEAALAAALRDNHALLDTIRQHAIVSVADRDGRIVEANDAFCRISGYARQELLGQNHRVINSGHHDRAFWHGMWTSLAAGRSWRAEVCNRAKDGSLYWVDSIVAPFLGADGRVEKYVSVRFDITAARQGVLELARERERLATIVAGTGAGTWEHDYATGADVVNDAYALMLGETPESFARGDGGFIDRVHPEDLPRVLQANLDHAEGRAADYQCEFRMRHRSGHWVWVQSRGRIAERDADGRPLRMAGIHLDVSERHAQHEALQQAHAAMQGIFENLPSAVSVFGPDLRLMASNQKYRTLLAFPDTLFDEPAPHYERFIRYNAERGEYGPADPDEIVRAALARLEGVVVEPHHFERTRPDGTVIEVRGAPMPGGGFVTTYTDISDRRQAEAAQQRLATTLNAVIEALPCGLTVHDAQGNIVLHNRQWQTLYRFDDAFLADRPFTARKVGRWVWKRGDYGDIGEAEALAAVDARVAEACRVPTTWLRGDALGGMLEVRSQPEPSTGGCVTTYTDVTRERAVQRDAERARNLLLGAIETIDEAFAIYDPDDRLVLCNERYRQVYADVADLIEPGVQFEALIRAGAERGGYVEAQGRVDEWVQERMARHLAADADHLQPLADGRTLRILERRLPDGHIVGFRIDVTELVQARENAEAASRAKSQFLANMSHEIRTPMNAILGLLKLLRRTTLDPRQDDYAMKTEGAARSLLALLNDILDFSKVEAGRMELDPQPFRVGSLLRDLQVLLEAARGDKGVALVFQLDPALPPALVGDSLRLQQVLLNLGGNALKFTERGEVVLATRVLDNDGRRVRLRFSVRDTGIGIAPEHQARIFSGFTQAEASTTRRYGGTGLGVAISQRLVKLMGGELQLQSQPGQGSRFWFDIDLPQAGLDDVEVVSPSAGPGDGSGRLAGLRILVAEDNANNQLVARELLEGEGASVTLADNGRLALQALGGQPFDVVLMDLQMPELDGLNATRQLRELGHRMPVVGLTANAMAQDRQACLDAGMDAHVGKPFDLDRLVTLLRRLTHRGPATEAAVSPSRRRLERAHARTAMHLDQSLEDEAEAAGVKLRAALERFGGRADVYLASYQDFVHGGLEAVHAEFVDLATTRRVVHSLKGLAATLGVDDLSARAAEVEALLGDAIAAGSTEPPESALPALRMSIDGRRPALLSLADRLSAAWQAPPPAPAKAQSHAETGAAGDALARLRARLEAADMEALEIVDQLLADHGDTLGGAGRQLQQTIHRLDFDTAVALITELERASA